jgi:Protein of unknown function (DUF3108)
MPSNHYRFARNAALAAAPVIVVAMLLASAGLLTFDLRAQQTIRPVPSRPRFNAPKPAAAAPTPFRVGESLNYQVSWTAFSSAASVQLNVVEQRNLFGWATWHLRVAAHTTGTVRSLFAVDDQFDSYTDAATIESRQYEMYLNELGKKEEKIVHMLPAGEVSRTSGPSVAVPQGTRDPVGAFYALRSVDWKATPQVRTPVYDGHDMYEVRSNLEARDEPVTVAAGKFSCSRVAIHVFEYQKEVSSIGFVVWFANNAARTPVQIEGNYPFGSVHAELIPAAQ